VQSLVRARYVGPNILGGYVWLNDQPRRSASQVFRARAANETIPAIPRLETITTVRLIVFSEVPLPITDWGRRFTHPHLTEGQVRFGLALEVRVEKLVRDQHPMVVV
jgi:hypothetical protein